MCQFCHQHGEGKKWYLNATNYSEELVADLKRRRYIGHFFQHPEGITGGAARLAQVNGLPAIVQGLVRPLITRRQMSHHYGQVLPLEDVAEVLSMTSSVVRLACICRYAAIKKEARFCYGLSLTPGGGKIKEILDELHGSFLQGPHTGGMEVLSPSDAFAAITRHDEAGLCHTIWTFQTPFIGGICNCDRADCQALNISLNLKTPVMFRAEYVAQINPDDCSGCKECLTVCHFGALEFSAALKLTRVNQRLCYGCGICRAACSTGAISLLERHSSAVSGLWS